MSRYDQLYSEFSDSYSSPDTVRERIAATERERQTDALERIAAAVEKIAAGSYYRIEIDPSDLPDFKE